MALPVPMYVIDFRHVASFRNQKSTGVGNRSQILNLPVKIPGGWAKVRVRFEVQPRPNLSYTFCVRPTHAPGDSAHFLSRFMEDFYRLIIRVAESDLHQI